MPHADHSFWVDPDDIASVVRFLSSESSAATTGAAIPVFGSDPYRDRDGARRRPILVAYDGSEDGRHAIEPAA